MRARDWRIFQAQGWLLLGGFAMAWAEERMSKGSGIIWVKVCHAEAIAFMERARGVIAELEEDRDG